MKPAFQKDDALLADIATARRRGQNRLWWLGQSGFLVHAAGKTVLFDPYLSDSLTHKYARTDKPHTRVTERVIAPDRLTGIDLITSSHHHTDHLDGETLRPLFAVNPGARLVVPRAHLELVRERLAALAGAAAGSTAGIPEARLVPIDAGETIAAKGVRLHGIPAAHNTVERDEQDRCRFLGYVLEIGTLTIYHSGDTMLHPSLAPALKRFSIDVALVPINGHKPERRVAGNLNGVEAAELSRAVGARLTIPHHFDMFEFNTEPPDEFEAACRRLHQPFRTLRQGEGVDL